MNDRGGDRGRTMIEKELGRREDRPAGGDLVVDEQAVLADDVTDDVRRFGFLVVARASLVDESDGQIETLGESTRVFRFSDVGGHHDRVREIPLLESLAKDRNRGELV